MAKAPAKKNSARSVKSKHRVKNVRHVKTKSTKNVGTSSKRKRGIGVERLETALRFIGDGQDLATAARSIRVSPERLKRFAVKKKLIRKSGGKWIVSGRLSRRMLLFSDGRELIVATRTVKAASLIGRYMTAVRHFLRSNNPTVLAEFADSAIKDTAGKVHPFEINPNVLYQLASAGGDHFEDIYRIVIK